MRTCRVGFNTSSFTTAIGNVAEVWPAGMVTEDGTVMESSRSLTSETTSGSVEAVLRVTVP